MGYDFQKMKHLIQASGVPQKKFFAKLGISEKIFEDWIKGTAIPREDVLKKVAKQLGVSLADLRDGVDVASKDSVPISPKQKSELKANVFVSNFIFLETDFPKLYDCGNSAEQLYLSGFYNESMIRLGMFGEFLVEKLLSALELDEYFEFKNYERLKFLYEDGYMHLRWYEILDKLRLTRNNILHESASISEHDALALLAQAFDVAKWFAHEVDLEVSNIAFIKPFCVVKSPKKEIIPIEPSEKAPEAIPFQKEKCEYTVSESPEGLCITSYIGNECVIEVPEKIQGVKVVAIGEQAFQNCSTLEKVFLPASIRSIETCAFAWCENLKEVSGATYTKSLGKRAFYRCQKLETVAPMVSVTHIGKETFAGCASLKSFFFADKLEGIASFAFAGCNSLTEVVLSYGFKLVGDHAFSDCNGLKKVILPQTVTFIGEEAFLNCDNLSALSYPAEATLGKNAFGVPKQSAPVAKGSAPKQPAIPEKKPESIPTEEPRKIDDTLDTIKKLLAEINAKVNQNGSQKMTLVEYLEYRGLEVIDKRNYGGCLWVVGTEGSIGEAINDAKEIFEIGGTYCGGGRATSYRPGWFSRARTTEARTIPNTVIEIDYDEIAPAGVLYDKYFGKIDGILILEDEAWTNEYCFVVDRLSDDGKKLEGVCYCNGRFQRYFSYAKTRKFKVFNGSTVEAVTQLHKQHHR